MPTVPPPRSVHAHAVTRRDDPDEVRSGADLRVRLFGRTALLLAGAVQTMAERYSMNPDGVSYLDIAHAYARGDWHHALNAYWSPMYSWAFAVLALGRPTGGSYDVDLVHALNLFIYVVALVCFEWFLCTILQPLDTDSGKRIDDVPRFHLVPTWVWYVTGYVLFGWSSLTLITTGIVTPDLLASAATYATSALLVRVWQRRAGSIALALLGLVLGLSYLTKSVMFVLAFVVAAVVFALELRENRWTSAARRTFTVLGAFLVVALPFAGALSVAKGRVTFGDAGRLNYAWLVTGTPRPLWSAGAPETGTPVHPERILSTDPDVFEFAAPMTATYAPWYDPSYWYEGARIRFHLGKQLFAMRSGWQTWLNTFSPLLPMIVAGIILIHGRVLVPLVHRYWLLLLPSTVGLVIYGLIFVDTRYVGAFIVVMVILVLAGLRPRRAGVAGTALLSLCGAAGVTTGLLTVDRIAGDASIVFRRASLGGAKDDRGLPDYMVIEAGLRKFGLASGTKIGVIGERGNSAALWAYPARLRIVAECDDAIQCLSDRTRDRVVRLMFASGAEAVIAVHPGTTPAGGWQRIGMTQAEMLLPPASR